MIDLDKISQYSKTRIIEGGQSTSRRFKEFLLPGKKNNKYVLDIEKILERINMLHQFLQKKAKDVDIYWVNRNEQLVKTCQLVCKKYGLNYFGKEKDVPGVLTNPLIGKYKENKKIIFIFSSPNLNKRLLYECSAVKIPIFLFCNSNFKLNNVDFILPVNVLDPNSMNLLLTELLNL